MPDQGVDEIITQFKHKRAYIQYGGPRPGNRMRYAGQDAQYLAINGVAAPETGGIDPIWVPDPARQNKWRLVGRSVSSADLASADVVFREKHGALSRALLKSCPFNLYETTGVCGDLQNFLGGWTDYVLIYSGAVVTDKDLGDRITFDSDDPVEDTLSVTLDEIYPIGSLGFSTIYSSLTAPDVVDLIFASLRDCENCQFDGQMLYGLVASASGQPASVIYSANLGASWSTAAIAGIGLLETVYAIRRIAGYLLVLGTDAYYYAEINRYTGAPGAFTKITTGFVATKSPRDVFALNPREVYFAGLGGYIYKSKDIASGVSVVSAGAATTSDLQRIHGSGTTLVASGAGGAVVRSTNMGATWVLTPVNPESLAAVQAVCVLDRDRYWIGTSTGRVYSTQDGGETWRQTNHVRLVGAIQDIVFPTQEVGYILIFTGAETRMLTTWNGGANWTDGENRLRQFASAAQGNRIACPDSGDAGVAANLLAIASQNP